MITLPGYQIIQTIHAGENTVLYQGVSEQDHQPVIIKVLASEYPSLAEITRLRHEYEILKNLDLSGIVKALNLLNYQNSFALILEDFGGESLKIFLTNKKLALTQYLHIVLQVIETLGQLHQNQILHKDIKPQNLIIHPGTLRLKITDFSIASRLDKENQTLSHPNLLEGTLAYISPEQTGRMNRSIDYRSDYYSLGVTCYEMLTRQLPFQSDDPMELVHCHIAKKPVPPNQLNPAIPVAVSDIVMKLLEKNAEDRYQSAAGLKYDIEFCLTHLEATDKIPNFVAGAQDKSSQLLIPQKLYGREQQVETLLAAFSRVATDELSITPILKSSVTSITHPLPELMLVSGYSGIGKSCLVHEIHKPIVRLRGYFINGKFDQFKRNIPYAAVIQAFQELIQKMRQWAEHASMNYQHKYDLVEAEKARVLGQFVEAMEYYDRAIYGAKEQGYIQDEALAHELAGEFYLSHGREKIAQNYMIEAYYRYIRPGAVAKVKDLEARYPQYLTRITHKQISDISVTRTAKTTTGGSLAALDLLTMLKATHAISQEIIFDKLLDNLMQIVMENAGAQKGLLFLEKSGNLFLAAESTVEPEKLIVLPFVNIDERPDLPVSVINYVQITRESVVLNDATNEGLFTSDRYIVEYRPRSILAMPVIYQGKLTGILYLENRSLVGAFTRDRLQVLSLLCAQISISIENASLYKDLQQSEAREREKATQLEAALHQLQNTQLQLVQSEKMSSLGQMVAGIAHEINNPVNFIKGNMDHASGYSHDLLHLIHLYQQHYPNPVNEIENEIDAIDLEFLSEDLPKILHSMKIGANRITEIVRTMRNFSRVDAMEMQPADIHEGIDSTLMILQHRLKAQPHRPTIEIIKEYGNLPDVECFLGQLNQVFMNILANSIDAIEQGVESKKSPTPYSLLGLKPQAILTPYIRIRTEVIDNLQVAIHITDNGPGMTEEVRCKLFNPFFTTKPVGKGTGIGLSISHQIVVEKHGGTISCISAPGEGTEFIIEIPITHENRENPALSGLIAM